MKIAIDFDGTCVVNEFPNIGDNCPGAVETLRQLVADGHELTLFTVRDGRFLDAALHWFNDNGIELEGIQYEKNQSSFTDSNKCYAEIYIDDRALGAPLIHEEGKNPYYDWSNVLFMINQVGDDPNPVPVLADCADEY